MHLLLSTRLLDLYKFWHRDTVLWTNASASIQVYTSIYFPKLQHVFPTVKSFINIILFFICKTSSCLVLLIPYHHFFQLLNSSAFEVNFLWKLKKRDNIILLLVQSSIHTLDSSWALRSLTTSALIVCGQFVVNRWLANVAVCPSTFLLIYLHTPDIAWKHIC